jgi:hypothetical protein
MPEELLHVFSHEVRRLSGLLFGSHGKAFISDDALAMALAKDLQNAPPSLKRVLKDFSRIALGTCVQVCFDPNQNDLEAFQATNIVVRFFPYPIQACLSPGEPQVGYYGHIGCT